MVGSGLTAGEGVDQPTQPPKGGERRGDQQCGEACSEAAQLVAHGDFAAQESDGPHQARDEGDCAADGEQQLHAPHASQSAAAEANGDLTDPLDR